MEGEDLLDPVLGSVISSEGAANEGQRSLVTMTNGVQYIDNRYDSRSAIIGAVLKFFSTCPQVLLRAVTPEANCLHLMLLICYQLLQCHFIYMHLYFSTRGFI